MRRILVIIAALMLLVSLAVMVWSQQPNQPEQPLIVPGNGPGPGPGGPPMRPHIGPACPVAAADSVLMPLFSVIPQLNMSEEQHRKLGEIMQKSEETIRPLRQKAAETSKQLREAMLAEKYDAKNIQELSAKAEKVEASLVAAETERWAKIRDILTTDQLRIVRETATRMPGPMGPGPMGGMNHGGGFMPGPASPPF